MSTLLYSVLHTESGTAEFFGWVEETENGYHLAQHWDQRRALVGTQINPPQNPENFLIS
jgi:hypothetical protein